MRITVPEEIMRLTVPTCTPSRDKPLVIVSPWELGGDGLHIFVWVETVQLVGCLGNLLRAPTLNRDYLFPLETWKGSLYARTYTYILKAKKFAEPPFQSKNIAEKLRAIFGPF